MELEEKLWIACDTLKKNLFANWFKILWYKEISKEDSFESMSELEKIWKEHNLWKLIWSSFNNIKKSIEAIKDVCTFFVIEKDWHLLPLQIWSFFGGELKIRNMWLSVINEWENFDVPVEIFKSLLDSIKSSDIPFKFDIVILNTDILNMLEDRWINIDIETTKIIDFTKLEEKSLDSYLSSLDQKTRYKLRKALKKFDKENFNFQIITEDNDSFKDELNFIMDMNIERFDWTSIYREIIEWEKSYWRKQVENLVWDWRINILKVTNSNSEYIWAFFHYSEWKQNLFINWFCDTSKEREAFKMVWLKYIESLIDSWYNEVDLMSYPWEWWEWRTWYKIKYGWVDKQMNLYTIQS